MHNRSQKRISSRVGLANIRNAVDIKVVLVPLLNLVAWHILPPALNALDSTSRQRIPPKPTIMNHPRYHTPIIYLLNGNFEISHERKYEIAKEDNASATIWITPGKLHIISTCHKTSLCMKICMKYTPKDNVDAFSIILI